MNGSIAAAVSGAGSASTCSLGEQSIELVQYVRHAHGDREFPNPATRRVDVHFRMGGKQALKILDILGAARNRFHYQQIFNTW
jgi:hypothetical protein